MIGAPRSPGIHNEPFRAYLDVTEDDVHRLLDVTPSGLSDVDAAGRLALLGPNAPATDAPPNPWRVLFRQFTTPLVGILIFAAVVSLMTRQWTDASIVLGIVLVSAVLSFAQEWRAARAVAELKSRIAPKTRVLRDGAFRMAPSVSLVPGDRIALSAGSIVPADARVVVSKDVQVDEATLTGETFPVTKRLGPVGAQTPLGQCHNVLFAGTTIRSGAVEAVVVSTGGATELGRVASHLGADVGETDFEHGVRRFGILISQVMVVLVGVVFVLNVVTDKPPIESLLFAIAIAVGMAPEMLPAIVTITLSTGARRMAESGVIVRRLAAIENLGSMDVFCTDKTGTLTLGAVTLDSSPGPGGAPSTRSLRLAWLNARLQSGFPNALDEAVIAYGTTRGMVDTGVSKVDEIAYDFVRKRLGVVFSEGGERTLVVKGQFARVLDVCTHVRDGDRATVLDAARRASLTKAADAYAETGLRALGVASRTIEVATSYDAAVEVEMTFEGFLLFADPPKHDVVGVLADLARLGVSVKVITGDSRASAMHVATTLGIDVTNVLTSRDIQALSDADLRVAAERTTLFTEVDPNQKERIVLALRHNGHCVGYMGDGINDGPALHAADVGISVESAVDVAKASADFVLLRPDLAVLRAGIEEGRRTFANTLKYVYTTTSANFGNMLSMACASAVLPFLPLLAKQVLLNNFLSDVPAMTIAGDGVDDELVLRPRRWNVGEIRRFMIAFGATSSAFDMLAFTFLGVVVRANPETFRTGWFVESLLTELAIIFVIRTQRPMWRSRPSSPLLWTSAVVAVVAAALPYTPIAPALGLVPLPAWVLASLVGLSVSYALASEALKRRLWSSIERAHEKSHPSRVRGSRRHP